MQPNINTLKRAVKNITTTNQYWEERRPYITTAWERREHQEKKLYLQHALMGCLDPYPRHHQVGPVLGLLHVTQFVTFVLLWRKGQERRRMKTERDRHTNHTSSPKERTNTRMGEMLARETNKKEAKERT